MRKFIFFKKRWSFYLFVPSPLQDELAAHVDRAAVYHGDGAVCGDRGGGETISETILKSKAGAINPSDSPDVIKPV